MRAVSVRVDLLVALPLMAVVMYHAFLSSTEAPALSKSLRSLDRGVDRPAPDTPSSSSDSTSARNRSADVAAVLGGSSSAGDAAVGSTGATDAPAADQQAVGSVDGENIKCTSPVTFRRPDKVGRAPDRLPCIPQDSAGLTKVVAQQFGVVGTYAPKLSPAKLNVAVEMSGQLRTYDKCHKSLVQHVLAPNQATLFLSTYPYLGDKRFGVRNEERDSLADLNHVADVYKPYLGAMYLVDLPTLKHHLVSVFPKLFQLKQWSWMIYQLAMMELAHNITASFQTSNGAPFDVVIRVRPDLFILGPITILPVNQSAARLEFTCAKNKKQSWSSEFNSQEIWRAPHHPVYEWVIDPLSDHSAVGFFHQMQKFLCLFSDIRKKTPTQQLRDVFYHGQTAEHIWGEYVARTGLAVRRAPGWHIMLRNRHSYRNSSHEISKSIRRKFLNTKIFGVWNPDTVGCPDLVEGSMLRLPKRKKKKKGEKRRPEDELKFDRVKVVDTDG